MNGQGLGRAQRHHRELPRAQGRARPPRATRSRPTPTPKASSTSSPTSSTRASSRSRGRATALQRLQGAFALGHHLRGPRRPDDRRAPGQPARHRPRHRRDVPGLGRHRARAFHRRHHLPRGGRLGGAAPRAAPRSSIAPASAVERAARSSRSPAALLVDKGNHRHFMAKEIHEQPEVISHTLANYLDMSGRHA